jgi:hypothetical protein
MITIRSSFVLTIAALFLAGYSFMGAAWTAPAGTPPNNNTDAPINVGSTTQAKTGNLMANIMAATTEMRANRYCDALGGNCVSSAGIGGGAWGTWTDVTPLRDARVWNKNNNSTAIMTWIYTGTGSGNSSVYISAVGSTSDQVLVSIADGDSGERKPTTTFIVPPGHYYYVDTNQSNIRNVSELVLPI